MRARRRSSRSRRRRRESRRMLRGVDWRSVVVWSEYAAHTGAGFVALIHACARCGSAGSLQRTWREARPVCLWRGRAPPQLFGRHVPSGPGPRNTAKHPASSLIRGQANWRHGVRLASSRPPAEAMPGMRAAQHDGRARRVSDDHGPVEIFGTFKRRHSPAELEGLGTGLSTVQRPVVRHGGRVWGEAEVRKGATVSFALPEAEHAAD